MFTIEPIKTATLDSTKGSFTYLVDEGKPLTIPIVSFLVTANDPEDDTVIVVDTGMREPDENGQVAGKDVDGGGPEPLREGLAERGVEPDNVDYVILTHLHHDHASNNDLFSDAEFLVQRAELEAARNPLPPLARTYLEENTETLESLDTTLVDGGYRLMDGIELRHTPGHTEGMQTVIVQTDDGPYALISDLAYCKQNLDPSATEIIDGEGKTIETTPVDYGYIAPGIHVDLAACYESIDRIREWVGEDGELIPGHDGAMLGQIFG